MKQILFFILAIGLLFSCWGEKKQEEKTPAVDTVTTSTSYIDTIPDQKIIVISDPQKVAEIRNIIEKKKAEDEKTDREYTENLSICYRYNQGDKTVTGQLIDSLENGNDVVRKGIYDKLYIDKKTASDPSPADRELFEAILKNLSREEDEKEIVEMSYHLALKYPAVFEERLYSGLSTDEMGIIGILSKHPAACTHKTLDRLITLVRSKQFNEDNAVTMTSALLNFAENGKTDMKKKVGDFCLEIYNKLLIGKKFFNEEGPYGAGSDVLDGIFRYAGPECKHLVQHHLRIEYKENEALKALVRHEGLMAEKTVRDYLRNKNKFFEAEEAALMLLQLKPGDEDLLREIFSAYEKAYSPDNYQSASFISTANKICGTAITEKGISFIKDPKMAARAKTALVTENTRAEGMAQDLYAFGLVEKPYTAAQLAKARQEEFDNNDDGSFSGVDFLSHSGIYCWVDQEDYYHDQADDVVLQLAGISKGKLDGGMAWADTLHISEDEREYVLTFIFNDKAYIYKPDNETDYNAHFIVRLLNKVLEDGQHTERFYRVGYHTGQDEEYEYYMEIVFGEKDKLQKLVDKYFADGVLEEI